MVAVIEYRRSASKIPYFGSNYCFRDLVLDVQLVLRRWPNDLFGLANVYGITPQQDRWLSIIEQPSQTKSRIRGAFWCSFSETNNPLYREGLTMTPGVLVLVQFEAISMEKRLLFKESVLLSRPVTLLQVYGPVGVVLNPFSKIHFKSPYRK